MSVFRGSVTPEILVNGPAGGNAGDTRCRPARQVYYRDFSGDNIEGGNASHCPLGSYKSKLVRGLLYTHESSARMRIHAVSKSIKTCENASPAEIKMRTCYCVQCIFHRQDIHNTSALFSIFFLLFVAFRYEQFNFLFPKLFSHDYI